MPHFIGPNRETFIVTRKVFQNLVRSIDQRAWETACLEQPNDSFREFRVDTKYNDPNDEYLRQWLLKNGAEESDEYVFLDICW